MMGSAVAAGGSGTGAATDWGSDLAVAGITPGAAQAIATPSPRLPHRPRELLIRPPLRPAARQLPRDSPLLRGVHVLSSRRLEEERSHVAGQDRARLRLHHV